ncbi:MAG TPA: hypothetical protein VFQ80_19710, partial [Thermomicrobiales bacterium]|nr:hypothetical protein [Thermomicrobiales bacterium]
MDGPTVPASPPQSNADAAPAAPAGAASPSEVEQLRQRLRFYEGFDKIIQDNISRAGELLRAAEEERRRAALGASAAREAAARATERRQALLRDLAADADALSRRILAAIDDGESDDAAEAPSTERQALASQPGTPVAAAVEHGDSAPEPPAEAPRSMTVIVHGLPDARSALSLQRHLAAVTGGGTVLAREFMAGIARFEVTGKTVTFDDLRRWDGGDGLRPVHVQPDVVEAAAPG